MRLKGGILPQPWRLESGSVLVNLPNSLLKNQFGPKVMLCVWRNFEDVTRWELFQTDVQSMRIFILK